MTSKKSSDFQLATPLPVRFLGDRLYTSRRRWTGGSGQVSVLGWNNMAAFGLGCRKPLTGWKWVGRWSSLPTIGTKQRPNLHFEADKQANEILSTEPMQWLRNYLSSQGHTHTHVETLAHLYNSSGGAKYQLHWLIWFGYTTDKQGFCPNAVFVNECNQNTI